MKKLFLLILLGCSVYSAHAQDVLTIAEGTTDISSEQGKSYDRIEMVRNIPDDTFTAFVVPATVDGYYFGADALRFVVIKMEPATNGAYNLQMVPMKDAEDFVPGNVYVVRPETGYGITDGQTVISFTAGIKTTVPTSSQVLSCTNDVKAYQAVTSVTSTVKWLNENGSQGSIDGKNGLKALDAIVKMLMNI